MGGKRVLMMGNSVTRGLYFEMRELLGEDGLRDRTSREDEKRACGRGGHPIKTAAEDPVLSRCGAPPCGCEVSSGIDHCTRLQFLWQQRTFDKRLVLDVQQ